MTDLEINIALAKAMGWVEISELDYINMRKTGFVVASDGIICAYNFCLLDFRFDYRDPVIFDAIIAHWELDIAWLDDIFTNEALVDVSMLHGNIFTRPKNKRYEAAALCVIDAVKRGVK